MGDRCSSHATDHVLSCWASLSYHAASVHPAVMGTWWNENWRIVNGISCGKCAEFSPEETRLHTREFQYQGCKLLSLLNSRGYQTVKHTHLHLHLLIRVDGSYFIHYSWTLQVSLISVKLLMTTTSQKWPPPTMPNTVVEVYHAGVEIHFAHTHLLINSLWLKSACQS